MEPGPLDMRLPRSCVRVDCFLNPDWRGARASAALEPNLKKKPKEEKRYT